jgi:hypothetical protein
MSTKTNSDTKHRTAAEPPAAGHASSRGPALRVAVLAVLVVGGFALSYSLAGGRVAPSAASAASGAAATPLASAGLAGGSPATATGTTGLGAAPGTPGARAGIGCACCGGAAAGGTSAGGGRGTPAAGGTRAASVQAGIQRITVDTSSGVYQPSTIQLKAGVPAEITFKQASGCLGQVVSQDLGFSENLTTGDKIVKLPALQKGSYGFSCGMRMVFGTVTVQ